MVEFHVLRCADCQTFQVLQVTKTTKWKCKMCDQKQSITKVYGQGSGADCRRHVQNLNSLHCQIKWTVEERHLTSASQVPASLGLSCPENFIDCKEASSKTAQGSRWSSFIDESNDETGEPMHADNENKSELLTTDWMKLQEKKKTWNKRRSEENEFPVFTGKKSRKIFNDETSFAGSVHNIQESDKSGYESYNSQICRNNIDIPVNSELGKICHSTSVSRVGTCDKNNFSLPLLSAGAIHGEKLSPPYPLPFERGEDNVCSQGSAGIQSCMDRDVSQKFWKEKPALNKKKWKQPSAAGTVVATKWDMFLESEDNIDDTDDDNEDSDYIYITSVDSAILNTDKQNLA